MTWSDDEDIFDDSDIFDDVNVNDTPPATARGGTESASNAVVEPNVVANDEVADSTATEPPPAAGEIASDTIGGTPNRIWGSSMQSFTQHHDLNLSMMSPSSETHPPPGVTPSSAAIVLAEEGGDNLNDDTVDEDGALNDGWGEDDLELSNVDDSLNADGGDMNNEHKMVVERGQPPETTIATDRGHNFNLGRAAETFGAALLASMDDDQDANHGFASNTEASEHKAEHANADRALQFGGFGGGFVMKGLTRFIEAATAPQEESEGSEEGDGWEEEDDDLDLEDGSLDGDDGANDVANVADIAVNEIIENISDEPELQGELLDNGEESGWDDLEVDVSMGDDNIRRSSEVKDSQPNLADTTTAVSPSIKDCVAKTESTLDSEFKINSWRTPIKHTHADREEEAVIVPNDGNNNVPVEVEQNVEVADVASKSLTDFVETLDAELNELQDNLKTVDDEPTPGSYEQNKNNSPEPVQPVKKESLPHQDSWYINAMEGGKGGVVYSNQNLIPEAERIHNKPIMPDSTGLSFQDVVPSSPVGMPLSEMPSRGNSIHSLASDENIANDCNYKELELQCNCLELIMPLPGNDNLSTKSGFGTKTLPDGTAVLVNYEKLLQNEATKRILLQRSVETYERSLDKLQAKLQASTALAQDHEEAREMLSSQITMAHNEIAELKELVSRLQTNQHESPLSEAHLFETELAAVAGEKEILRRELDDLREELRVSSDSSSKIEESRNGLMVHLEESKSEQSRLENELQLLQSENAKLNEKVQILESVAMDSSELSDETNVFLARVGSLEIELLAKSNNIDQLNAQVSELLSGQTNMSSENQRLKEEYDQSQQELAEVKISLVSLENGNTTLRSMQQNADAQIAELTATIETMEAESEEAHRLTGEVASLTYELGIKTTESEQTAATLQSLQTKLEIAEARLVSLDQASNESNKSNEIENSLRAENELLKTKLEELQIAFTSLGSQKSDVDKQLEEGISNARMIEVEIQTLRDNALEASHLQDELSALRAAFDAKTMEQQSAVASYEQLQLEFTNVQTKLDDITRGNEETSALAREEIARLESQIDEVQKHHTNTTTYLEEQLAIMMNHNSTLNAQCDELKLQMQSSSEAIATHTEQVFKLEIENRELAAALKVANESSLASEQRMIAADEDKLRLESLLDQNKELRDKHALSIRENARIVQSLEAKVGAAEHQCSLLEQQCEDLRSTNEHSQQALSISESDVASLKRKIESLSDANRQLEDKLFEASFVDVDDNVADDSQSLREENDELAREVEALSVRVADLQSQVDSMTSEKEALLTRIGELEEALRDDNVTELRDELTSLHEERQQLDLDNEELLVQLGLMQQDKADHEEALQEEVTKLRGQVSTLEDKCKSLQQELESSHSISRTADGNDGIAMRSNLEMLHEENAVLLNNISLLSSEKSSLEIDIHTLTQTVKSLEQQHPFGIDNSAADDDEIKGLREKATLLELKLADKEHEIVSLKKEMQNLNSLQGTAKDDNVSTQVEEKSAEIRSLNDEIDATEEEKDYDDDESLQDLLADEEVESDDYLRNQIVILAYALEKSELQRADALDRVIKERKSNAESIRQLGESVKRFYSTVRCSDAV
eukprot:scaffold237_cov181-Alexandrium_tamarense.AAC.26